MAEVILYEQRINGNILEHSEIISTEQYQIITDNEKRNIRQSLEYYLIKADATHSIDAEHMFKEKETTKWKIEITFAPVETLKEDDASIINTNISNNYSSGDSKNEIDPKVENQLEEDELSLKEVKYLKRVKILVEDSGIISEEDRRILERVRMKLALPLERAASIEELVIYKSLPSYSEIELQYIDEDKFCLEDDGIISPKERQLLDQERDDLNISNEHALNLENYVKSIMGNI